MSSLWRGYVINETQLYNESMGKVQNLTSYQSLHVANASDYIALGPFSNALPLMCRTIWLKTNGTDYIV